MRWATKTRPRRRAGRGRGRRPSIPHRIPIRPRSRRGACRPASHGQWRRSRWSRSPRESSRSAASVRSGRRIPRRLPRPGRWPRRPAISRARSRRRPSSRRRRCPRPTRPRTPGTTLVTVTSTPAGAAVLDADDRLLGTTPFDLRVPTDKPLQLTLRHDGYKPLHAEEAARRRAGVAQRDDEEDREVGRLPDARQEIGRVQGRSLLMHG